MRRCPECGSTDITTSTETRPYSQGSLPQVVIADVTVRKCSACGREALAIPNIAGLHRTIARGLVWRHTRLRGPELRFLRKYLGLSSATYANVVGVSDETVLAWEAGTRRPPFRTELMLRAMILTQAPVESYDDDHLSIPPPSGSGSTRLRVRPSDGGWRSMSN